MAGKKPTHEALLVYDEKDKDGTVVTRFHQVCAMRLSENGNLMMNIPKGMLLSGKVLIKEVKDKPREKSEAEQSMEEEGDSLPF